MFSCSRVLGYVAAALGVVVLAIGAWTIGAAAGAHGASSVTHKSTIARRPSVHAADILAGYTPALGQPYDPSAVPVTLSTAQSETPVLLPNAGSANAALLGKVYLSTYPYADGSNSPAAHTVELWYPSSGVEILEYPLLPPDTAATWLAGERALSVPQSVAPSFVTLDGTTAAVDDSAHSANGGSFVGLVLDRNVVVEITAAPPTTLAQLEAIAASM